LTPNLAQNPGIFTLRRFLHLRKAELFSDGSNGDVIKEPVVPLP
jgi:hypothetical protein